MAIGWALGAKLLGGGMKAMGAKKQQKANDRAMDEARAAESKYNDEVTAWEQQQADAQHAHAQAAHAAAMAQYNKQREAELNVLKNQGATQEELFEHDKGMRDQMMAEAQNFNVENYGAGVAENQEAAQAEGQQALDAARETREGPNMEGRSTAFREAATKAMAGADAAGDTRNAGMSKLTGRTRDRGGEVSSERRMGVNAASGNQVKDHIGKMGDMRGNRLGYVKPQAPTGPGPRVDLSTRPQEPEMEIQTSSSGNKLSALGSAVGAAGGWLGGTSPGANGAMQSNSSWLSGKVGGLFGGK